jgi:hypothetical protein
LVFRQASDTWERAATVGYGYCDKDFIGSGGVGNADFHAVEVAADECGVLVT